MVLVLRTYPVDDGELAGGVAVDAAHLLGHPLVVVVLLAVGLLRPRAAAAAAGEDRVEPLGGPAPRERRRRRRPRHEVRGHDGELREHGIYGAVVGALESHGVGGVRRAHAEVGGHRGGQSHRRRRGGVPRRELRRQRLRVQRHDAPRLDAARLRRRGGASSTSMGPWGSPDVAGDHAPLGDHGGIRHRLRRRPAAAEVQRHAAADDGAAAEALGDGGVDHLGGAPCHMAGLRT